MNPTVSEEFIAKETERDPSKAAAEYGAEFRTDVERLLTREAIMACVQPTVHERAPQRNHAYVGFVDPSGGANDAFTLAIAHKEQKTVILDVIRERTPPFSPEAVCAEYAAVLKKYRVSSVIGDKYSGQFVIEQFSKNGVFYEPAARSKSELYGDLVAVINSGGVDLLDNAKLIGQLVGLERRSRAGGRDQIDHAPGGHDDLANAVAGAVLSENIGGDPRFHRTLVYPQSFIA
jgi:hypothetical protein